ncbi:MAG: tetratricopeptide repeat-containing serine protease family protein [Candidatus Sulfobium sp.]
MTIYSGKVGSRQAGITKGFFVDKGGVVAVPYMPIFSTVPGPGNILFVRTAEGSYIQTDRVLAVDKPHGIVLLKIDLVDPPMVRLCPDGPPVPGETVFIESGRTDSGQPVVERKAVASAEDKDTVLLNPPSPAGTGGGPVFNQKGCVVAMLERETKDGAVTDRLIPSVYIADLLKEYRKSEPLGLDESRSEEEPGPGTDELELELEKAKSLVEQEPENARAFVMLGWAYSRLGMYADAIEAYRDAAALRPGSAGIYNNIGVIYGMDMGMYDKAVKEFEKALQLKPDYDEARFNLAIAYLFAGERDSAMKEYRKLKVTDPERALRLFQLIYEKQKEEDAEGVAGGTE